MTLTRCRCKQPVNLILDVVKEAVPTVHIAKSERAYIIDLFKKVYYDYWTNQQGNLVMVPAMNATELTLTILSCAQHVATMTKAAQKTSDENAWSLVTAQTDLKARMEEISNSKDQLVKKTPESK